MSRTRGHVESSKCYCHCLLFAQQIYKSVHSVHEHKIAASGIEFIGYARELLKQEFHEFFDQHFRAVKAFVN